MRPDNSRHRLALKVPRAGLYRFEFFRPGVLRHLALPPELPYALELPRDGFSTHAGAMPFQYSSVLMPRAVAVKDELKIIVP